MRGLVVSVALSAGVLGAVALAGCSKPADNAAAGANTAAAAAAPVAATPAATPAVASGPAGPITLAQLPAPTAGQWSRSSSQDGAAAEPGTKCMDGKPIDPTDGVMKCPKMDVTRTATGGFVVVADCTGGGPGGAMKAKLNLAGEGDFSKSFTTDATMTMTGGPGGDMTTKNHSVYTYVGPTCTK